MLRLRTVVAFGCISLMAGEADDRAAFLAAIARAPAVQAAQQAVQAARLAQRAAGVLPDPMLSVEAGRTRTRMGETMRMYGVMIEQPLPRWGERDAARLGAGAGVAMAEAELAQVVAEHAAMWTRAAAEAAAASARLAVLVATEQRLAALDAVVRVRAAGTGTSTSLEVLAVASRREQVAVQQHDERRRADDAAAEVRALLALPAEVTLPVPSAPGDLLEPPPEVRLAQAAQAEAEAMLREAQARSLPETAVGVAVSREAAGTDAQEDAIAVSLRVSLPVWRPAYAAAADAARLRARAAAPRAHAAQAQARARRDRADRARAVVAAAHTAAAAAAARAAAEYQALLHQVASGGATVPMALDILDRIAEAQMAAIDAEEASRMAEAELWLVAAPVLPERESP